MEYHYRTVRCPNCNEVADRTKTVDKDWKFGTPLRSCPYCGRKYFDSFYKEEGIERFQDNGVHINAWSVIWLIVSLLFVIGFLSSSDAKVGAIIFGVIFVIFAIGFLRTIKALFHPKEYHQKQVDLIEGRGETMSAELAESMRRLSKKEYLDELAHNGVIVPQYFYDRIKKYEPVQSTQLIQSVQIQPSKAPPKNNENSYLKDLENLKTMLEEFQASKPQYNENALNIYYYRIAYLLGTMRDNPNVNEIAYSDAGNVFRTIALDFYRKNDDLQTALFFIKKLENVSGFSPEFYHQLADDEMQLSISDEIEKDNDNESLAPCEIEAIPTQEENEVKSLSFGEKESDSLFCRKCGAKLPLDSDFCIRCGAKVIR